MMLQQKNRKIFTYIFLFFITATFNNKNFNSNNFGKINKITIDGLDKKDNIELVENLIFLENENIFFLNKIEIKKIIEANSIVEKYSILKIYPSSLNIKIEKTKFLAFTKKKGNIFLLGSNGKLTKINYQNHIHNIPIIFGDFKIKNFFELKDIMDETNFDFNQVKNLFFFKSGRWDVETKSGLLIQLPKKELKKSLVSFMNFLDTKDLKEIKKIDLRQYNQIIING